jgi:hypothetical protein
MYNYTNGAVKWKTALDKFIKKQADTFYPEEKGSVMVEICEALNVCNADQESFKAYLARWLGVTVQMAPYTRDVIMPLLQHSAVRAAQTCNGPSNHNGGSYQCGMTWYHDGYDGKYGVGPQMAALNTISVLNAERVPPPYTSRTGGTSQGNPGLNTGDDSTRLPIFNDHKATTADKAGAAILTIMVLGGMLGGGYWMIS